MVREREEKKGRYSDEKIGLRKKVYLVRRESKQLQFSWNVSGVQSSLNMEREKR